MKLKQKITGIFKNYSKMLVKIIQSSQRSKRAGTSHQLIALKYEKSNLHFYFHLTYIIHKNIKFHLLNHKLLPYF